MHLFGLNSGKNVFFFNIPNEINTHEYPESSPEKSTRFS